MCVYLCVARGARVYCSLPDSLPCFLEPFLPAEATIVVVELEVQGMEQKILEGDDDGQNLLRHDSLGLCLHFSKVGQTTTCNHYFSEFFVWVSADVQSIHSDKYVLLKRRLKT